MSKTKKPISLKALRAMAGLTQKQLASKLGKSVTTISNWENGITIMNLEDYNKLIEIVEIPAGYFLN